ncbi:hypothetical protein [Leifsonia sp. NPDC058248]|uniref:hypothetical protein n=1 Tax=Leifsonia sp. NPDC058248 TaxID=3346402 RepID=UPI0036DEDEF9
MTTTPRASGAALTATIAIVAVATSLGLTGCTVSYGACASWADFSDPDVAYAQATTVVAGHVAGRDGTMDTDLGPVRAYRFTVDEAFKGAAAGSTIRLGSRADSCDGGDGYVSGDLLATDSRVLVYALKDRDGPVTLTPAQGVSAFPEGTAAPFRD